MSELLKTKGSAGHPSFFSAVLVFGPLALLAEVLIVGTRHRPLGAATFAIAAIAAWFLSELLSRRVLDPSVCAQRAFARKVVGGLGATLSVAVLFRAIL